MLPAANELIAALGGRTSLTERAALAELAVLVSGRRFLAVLDDVWELAQIEPFLAAVAGSRSRLVVTTRDAGLATAVGANEQRLSTLTDDQSVALVRKWAGADDGPPSPAVRNVVRECGNLPLALAICGALVREQVPWEDLAAALASARLDALQFDLLGYPYADVFKALAVSLDVLEASDPQGAALYRMLAVFPAGEFVPETAVVRLWTHVRPLDPLAARALVARLDRKSLLRLDVSGATRSISLHDLQHDFLTASAPDMQALHASLLDAYWAACGGQWSGGPDDGYFFSHLGHHLVAGGRTEEFHDLLVAERSDGRNAWFEARAGVDDIEGYAADVSKAWDLAEADGNGVVAQCRCALISSSLLSLSANTPPNLVVAAVEHRVWSTSRAMSVVRRIPDQRDQATARALLLRLLHGRERDDWVRESVAGASRIDDPGYATEAVAHLVDAAGAPAAPWFVEAVLDRVVASLGDSNERLAIEPSEVLAALIPFLRPEDVQRTLEAVRQSPKADVRARCLGALAPATGDEQQGLLDEAMAEPVHVAIKAQALDYAAARIDSDVIAPYAVRVFAEAIDALAVDRTGFALDRVLPALPAPLQADALRKFLAAFGELIESPHDKAKRLGRLARRLPAALNLLLLPAAHADYEHLTVMALAGIAPHLRRDDRDAVVTEIMTRTSSLLDADDSYGIATVAAEFGPVVAFLPGPFRERLVRRAQAIMDVEQRAVAVAVLVAGASEAVREAELGPVLSAIARHPESRVAHPALDVLSPALPPSLVPAAIEASQAARDDGFEQAGFKLLVDQLGVDDRLRALRWILAQATDRVADEVHAETTAELVEGVLAETGDDSIRATALALGRAMSHVPAKVRCFAALVEHAGPDAASLWVEARDLAYEIVRPYWKAKSLAHLIGVAPEGERRDVIDGALAAAAEETYVPVRARLLAPVLVHLEVEQRDAVVVSLLADAETKALGSVLQHVAPFLTDDRVRAEADGLQWSLNDHDVAAGVPAVLGRLSEVDLDTAMMLWRRIDGRILRADAMKAIAPNASLEAITAVLDDADAHDDVVAVAAPRLAALGRSDEALAAANRLPAGGTRLLARLRVARHLPSPRAAEVAALATAEDLPLVGYVEEFWRALTILAPHLAGVAPDVLRSDFNGILRSIGSRIRLQALPGLYAVSPLVAALGGERAVARALDAVIAVRRWWPSLPPA